MSRKSELFRYSLAKKQITISIKVKAGAKQNSIDEFILVDKLSYLKISIKAIAESGRANLMIVSHISKQWQIPRRNIEIISGLNSNYKIIAIKNVEIEYLEKLLIEKLPIA